MPMGMTTWLSLVRQLYPRQPGFGVDEHSRFNVHEISVLQQFPEYGANRETRLLRKPPLGFFEVEDAIEKIKVGSEIVSRRSQS